MPAAADARRARRPGSLYRRPCRGYRLCYAGAMLPPGADSLPAQALIESGVARVVVGSRDPNPKVAGRAYRACALPAWQWKKILRRECDALNEVFFHYITARTPFVALKYAMTADGKIAARTGRSQWITGETARAHVHSLRSRYRAIWWASAPYWRMTLCSPAALKAGATRCAWCWTAVLRTPFDRRMPYRRRNKIPDLYIAVWKTRKSAPLNWNGHGVHILECKTEKRARRLADLMQASSAQASTVCFSKAVRSVLQRCGRCGAPAVQSMCPKILGGAGAKSPSEVWGI